MVKVIYDSHSIHIENCPISFLPKNMSKKVWGGTGRQQEMISSAGIMIDPVEDKQIENFSARWRFEKKQQGSYEQGSSLTESSAGVGITLPSAE